MGERKTERGQGLVEMVVILPVLLILMVGAVEMGYGLRNYLLVVNAAREGCRFAARGRFSDEHVGSRVVSAGGVVSQGGADVPFLRTHGTEPNTGIIVTHVSMDTSGTVVAHTVWVSGVIPNGTGGVRSVLPPGPSESISPDSVISMTQLVDRHGPATQSINQTREAAMYEPMDNHIVIVEVHFMHHPLWNMIFVPLPDPWMMYAKSEMRVITDRGR